MKITKVNVNQGRLKQNKEHKKTLASVQVSTKGSSASFCHEAHIMGPCVVMQSPCGKHVSIIVEGDIEIKMVNRD